MKTRVSFSLFSLCVSGLWGQESRGSIVGTVSDASGAVVAGATVEVLNLAMGTRNKLNTNEAGQYVTSFLIPGSYRVTVENAGFKKNCARRNRVACQRPPDC